MSAPPRCTPTSTGCRSQIPGRRAVHHEPRHRDPQRSRRGRRRRRTRSHRHRLPALRPHQRRPVRLDLLPPLSDNDDLANANRSLLDVFVLVYPRWDSPQTNHTSRHAAPAAPSTASAPSNWHRAPPPTTTPSTATSSKHSAAAYDPTSHQETRPLKPRARRPAPTRTRLTNGGR